MLFREDQVARADAEAIRKGVGFYRWTHDLVEITGKDALEVLQKIYISDISKVAVGRSKYTASLDENGEIIDDVIVMHMADGLYWVSDLYGPRLLPWIEQHKDEGVVNLRHFVAGEFNIHHSADYLNDLSDTHGLILGIQIS